MLSYLRTRNIYRMHAYCTFCISSASQHLHTSACATYRYVNSVVFSFTLNMDLSGYRTFKLLNVLPKCWKYVFNMWKSYPFQILDLRCNCPLCCLAFNVIVKFLICLSTCRSLPNNKALAFNEFRINKWYAEDKSIDFKSLVMFWRADLISLVGKDR